MNSCDIVLKIIFKQFTYLERWYKIS